MLFRSLLLDHEETVPSDWGGHTHGFDSSRSLRGSRDWFLSVCDDLHESASQLLPSEPKSSSGRGTCWPNSHLPACLSSDFSAGFCCEEFDPEKNPCRVLGAGRTFCCIHRRTLCDRNNWVRPLGPIGCRDSDCAGRIAWRDLDDAPGS